MINDVIKKKRKQLRGRTNFEDQRFRLKYENRSSNTSKIRGQHRRKIDVENAFERHVVFCIVFLDFWLPT